MQVLGFFLPRNGYCNIGFGRVAGGAVIAASLPIASTSAR